MGSSPCGLAQAEPSPPASIILLADASHKMVPTLLYEARRRGRSGAATAAWELEIGGRFTARYLKMT